jgi:ribosomal protein L6P/L9E
MIQQIQKNLFLPAKPKVFFGSIKNSKLLILETSFSTKKYLKLHPAFSVKKAQLSLLICNEKSSDTKGIFFEKYTHLCSVWLKKFSKPFRKQLLLKGLGFKGNISEGGLFLELKLGFSHLVKVAINLSELKMSMNTTLLVVEGFEAYKVGNFLKKIRNLKAPDAYKGKGFWYKNEVKIFKDIKKT